MGARMSAKSVARFDVAVILWCLLCLTIGIWVGRRIDTLGALGQGVVEAGGGIGSAADALRDLDGTPLIGGVIGSIADEIDGLADATIARGEAGQDAVRRVAVVTGAALVLLPTLPPVVIWLLIRMPWAREREAIRAALVAGDPRVREYLANLTLGSLPYRELAAVSDDPFGDVRAGRFDALAAVQARRWGLVTRPDPQTSADEPV